MQLYLNMFLFVRKTVPDTISKWGTGDCYTISLGMAPIMVSVPRSLIRGEELTLKATVANTVFKCIMVRHSKSLTFNLSCLSHSSLCLLQA